MARHHQGHSTKSTRIGSFAFLQPPDIFLPFRLQVESAGEATPEESDPETR